MNVYLRKLVPFNLDKTATHPNVVSYISRPEAEALPLQYSSRQTSYLDWAAYPPAALYCTWPGLVPCLSSLCLELKYSPGSQKAHRNLDSQ